MSKHIDSILSLINSILGSDDNGHVPTQFEMRSSGLGDAHDMSFVEITVEERRQASELEALEESLCDLHAQGADLYHEKDAYTDSAESLAEWQAGLDSIAAQMRCLEEQIATLQA